MTGRPRRRRRVRVLVAGVFGAVLGFALVGAVVADRVAPLPLGTVGDVSREVVDRHGHTLHVFLNGRDRWRLAAEADDVGEQFRRLLIAVEDRRFHRHPGVDPVAVARAIWQNLAAGRIVSGASTLTMQVARLIEPRPRTLRAKVIEAVRAVQLEWRFTKDEILGLYLTLAPYGGNIEGVRAAARLWFASRPDRLTLAEAALLVALPQAPSALRPDRWPARARAARARVLARGVAAGVITAEAAAVAAATPVPARRGSMPRAAPHLARALAAGARSGQTVIETTLDRGLQRAVEALARREAATLHPRAGLAILVAETATGAVAAYVGASDPFDHRRHGPIDMVRAVRSPGSALKPFIYALAFDDGLIHPETLVSDASARFGGYAPANFDGGFRGELSIREALQRSLNVPAVRLLDRIGSVRFAAALSAVGATLVLPQTALGPGLPLALGGVSVSLWDMVTLYLGLARGGAVVPLRAVPGVEAAPVRLVGAAAAYDVVRVLEGTPAPVGWAVGGVRRRHRVAFKTGTSYGFRDAWCFGMTEGYTIGVWVGRPDGTPSPGRYGANTAAPVLFRVFDLLPAPALASAAPAALPERAAPALLRRLAGSQAIDPAAAIADPDAVRLVFPTDGLAIDPAPGDLRSMTLVAAGGRRPLTWLIDGRPIPSRPARRDAHWSPSGPGFARVTVIDADGRSAAAEIEVR